MRGAQGYMLFLGLLLAAIHQPAAAFVAISVVPQGGLPSVAAGVGRAGGLQVGGFIARRVAISRISGGARAGARCGIGTLRICGIEQPRLNFSSESRKSSKVHSKVSKLGTKCHEKLMLRSNFCSDVGEEGLEEARDCGGEQAGVCVCVCTKLGTVPVVNKVGRCSYGIDCGAVVENKQVRNLLAVLVQKYVQMY